MLKSVIEGMNADNLSGPSKKRVEDLGRCVNPAQPSPLNITSGVRIVCNIESVVSERADHPHDLPESHPDSTEEHLIAYRTEMWEILRGFDVCGSHLTVPTVS